MSPKPDLCLVGAGGQGRVVAAQIRESALRDRWGEIVFCDSGATPGETCDGHAVRFAQVEEVRDAEVLVTVGNNAARAQLLARARARGLRVTGFVSPRAHILSAAPLGAGTVVLAGAVINWAATLGAGVIVNSNAVIEHDAVVGDHCHISPGAVLAGGVRLGEGCWVGANASVIQQVRLGDHVTLGAGAVAVEDLRRPGVYVGAPARQVD